MVLKCVVLFYMFGCSEDGVVTKSGVYNSYCLSCCLNS